MPEIIRFYSEDGDVLGEMEYSLEEACRPYDGGFCGGCCRCQAMQAEHSGTCYEIVPDDRPLA